ncbi:hypothetical protein M413DRAFT_449242 [Hebeloma cylindrosporum]|uniref:Uncharacterized protein n=1 Tax=Hebeloma cylindrosporum TaxID=76867 RepID=A0A0C2XEL7_HEBCY|nr:hypothetical protein M413DRAFT_449242 [Hebeloma cylindrosporum h7]
MPVDDFKELFATLNARCSNKPLSTHPRMTPWRGRLPKAGRAKVPKLRLIPFPGMGPKDGVASEKTVEKVFFPIRYVRYIGEEQSLRNEDNKDSGRRTKQINSGLMSLFDLWRPGGADWA